MGALLSVPPTRPHPRPSPASGRGDNRIGFGPSPASARAVRVLARFGVPQAEAARRLKVSQPKVSALLNYRLQGFSVERLMKFLTALDRDIEIVIHPKSRTGKGGRILVTAA